MIKRLLNRVLCRLGYHKTIVIPVVSHTLWDGRPVLATATICTHCDYRNEFH